MMKFTLLLVVLLTLVGCESGGEDVSVIMPSGAPSLAHIDIEYDLYSRGITPQNDVVFGGDPLLSAFQNESHDVIIGPFNLGVNMIERGQSPYLLAAVITWGNLYFVSEHPLTGLDALSGQDIILFGEGSMPDLTIQALFNETQFDQEPNIQYVESMDMAVAKIQSGEDVIALTAEPRTSVLLNVNPELHVLDVQSVWENTFDTVGGYPQAAVFVHENLDVMHVESYLNQLEQSISFVNEHPDSAAAYADVLEGYPFPSHVLETAIPGSHMRYVTALEARAAVEAYVEKILTTNPDAPLSKPHDDTYYRD